MRRLMSMILVASIGIVAVPSSGAAEDGVHFKGTVTNVEGAPVTGACVSVRVRFELREVIRACTDASGQYATGVLAAGTYFLHFSASGLVPQYAPGKPNILSAGSQTPIAGGRVVNAVLEQHAGTIAGTLTGQDGKPISYATVNLSGRLTARVHTRIDGTYELPHLPVGNYKVRWQAGNNSTQWAVGKTAETADTFAIAANAVTTVSDQLTAPATGLPSNEISGFVGDVATGAAVAGAKVSVTLRTDLEELGSVIAGPDGRYRIAGLPDGNYRLQVNASGYPDVWNGAAATPSQAPNLYLTPSTPDPIVNLPIFRAAAEITGQIRDPQGQPVVANLDLRGTVSTGFGTFRPTIFNVKTQPDGTYRFTVAPGSWTLGINTTSLGYQWAHQKPTEAEATPIALAGGAVTTVDEQFAPRGRIELTIIDQQSDLPVAGACVSATTLGFHRPMQCGGSTAGVYLLEDLPPGEFDLQTDADTYLRRGFGRIKVQSGQTTRLTVRARAAGTITIPIAPVNGVVPSACAYVVPVAFGEEWMIDSQAHCTNTGTLTIPKARTGRSNLFIVPNSESLGVQWLGAGGGTGDRRQAAVIEVTQGRSTAAPTVRFDPAGSITGTVSSDDSALTGAWVWVRPFGVAPGLETSSSNLPWYTTATQVGQTYRLDRLGPYAWPIEFRGTEVASVWSGNAANRFEATPVQVNSGQISTLDPVVRRSAKFPFAGIDLGPDAPPYWSAAAYHAVTGDMLGSAVYHQVDLGDLTTGPIFISFDNYDSDRPHCWYRQPVAGFGGRRGGSQPVVNVVAGQVYPSLKLIPGQTCIEVRPTLLQPPPRRG